MESNVNNMIATVVAAIAATIADFYAHLAPWLLLGAILVIVDLRFGIKAARARGEEIRPSRAWRRTINKTMDYLCWVTVAEMCSRTFAPAIGVPVVSLGMLIVIYGIELSSCINNYFEYKHVDRRISIFKLLKGTKWGALLDKAEERGTEAETEEAEAEAEAETEKWN